MSGNSWANGGDMQDFSRAAGMYLPGPQIVYWHFASCCKFNPDIPALNQAQVQISCAEGQSQVGRHGCFPV